MIEPRAVALVTTPAAKVALVHAFIEALPELPLAVRLDLLDFTDELLRREARAAAELAMSRPARFHAHAVAA